MDQFSDWSLTLLGQAAIGLLTSWIEGLLDTLRQMLFFSLVAHSVRRIAQSAKRIAVLHLRFCAMRHALCSLLLSSSSLVNRLSFLLKSPQPLSSIFRWNTCFICTGLNCQTGVKLRIFPPVDGELGLSQCDGARLRYFP